MRRIGVRRESGRISELMIDHIKGRSLVRDMNLAILRYVKHDREAPARFVERAKSYIHLLIEHIRKEDEAYFPTVEKALSEKQKKELLKSFEEREMTEAGRNEYASMQGDATMKKCRILSTSIVAFLWVFIFSQSWATAQPLKERNEVLFEQLRRVHGLSDKQMESIRGIFRESGYIGQGNPAVTEHPMTPRD